MSPPTKFEEFTKQLVSLGEAEVRAKLLQRIWNYPRKEWATAWLGLEEKNRALAAESRAETREEESITIAKRALSLATEANRIASEDLFAARSSAAGAFDQARWARWAAVIAAVAAIIAAKNEILVLVFG